jgi:eukaryotic-like serine/threonine-protein kinase
MAMPLTTRPEIERRALALFEHLADDPANTKLRTRMLKNESEAVLARLHALEASVTRARGAIPTLIPGSADCGGTLPPPECVGAFRLIERIGRGGMGDVWLGQRDDGLYDQKVAVKLIQRHALARAAGAFDDERRFLARLEHPNIARLIDGGVTEDGLPWLAMEFFDGQPIDVASEALPLRERVGLFIKAADAVQYAHSRLIAHADLKPSNILVDHSGRVKLLDFGIAGLIGAEPRGPSGSGPLTRDFASPERIAGGGPSVADDVFALGKTLSLTLDGQNDRDLAAIAAKANHKDPDERYGSVAELIADLDRWRERLPVNAMHDGLGYRIGKFIDRHRVGVFATALVMIGLGATSVVATTNYVRAEREQVNAAARFDDAHRAANYLMFNVMTRLESQRGSLQMRANIARVAQTYLDRLAQVPNAPVAVRMDTAAGLIRIAELSGASPFPNLSDYKQAQENLGRASAILKPLLVSDPSNVKLFGQMGQVYALQCRMQIYGDHNPDKALALARAGIAVLANKAATPDIENSRWALRLCEGDAMVWREETTPAIALLSNELAHARARARLNPGSIDQAMIGRNLRFLGEAYFYAHRLPEAAKTHEEAFALMTRLRDAMPGDQRNLSNYVSIADDLASTYSVLHRPRDGLNVAQKAYDATVEAARLDPSDLGSLRRGLSIARIVAYYKAQLGKPAEGIALMTETDRQWRALVARFPDDAALARLHILSLRPHGDVYRFAGRIKDACARYAEASSGWAAFDTRWGLSASDKSEDVAFIKQDIDACAGRGKFADD